MAENPSHKESLRNLVLEWQQKHGLGDNDPLLLTAELWEMLIGNTKSPDSTPAYFKFRQDLQNLDEISKTLSKQAGDLAGQLQKVPKIASDLTKFPYFTVFLAAFQALVIGILIGKFLLSK